MAKQKFKGKIVSNKMQRTVVVEIERRIVHPLYKKRIKRTNKIKADSAEMKLSEGDVVTIESTSPISKTKNFKVIEKIESNTKVKKVSKKDSSKKRKGGKK